MHNNKMWTIKEVEELEKKIDSDLIFEDLSNGVKFICKLNCQSVCDVYPINLDELGFTDYTRILGVEKLVELIKEKYVKMERLLKKYLGFSKTESKVLALFLASDDKKQFFHLKEIAEQIERDRSSVSKIVKYINSFGILRTRQINLDRGFRLEYQITSRVKIFDMIKKEIESNYKKELARISEIKRGFDD